MINRYNPPLPPLTDANSLATTQAYCPALQAKRYIVFIIVNFLLPLRIIIS